jgi:hypothetical protein
MSTVPASPLPGNETPSLHDLLSDAAVRVEVLPASELDAAFAYGADRLDDEEIDRLYAERMEAIGEPPARFAPLDELPVLRTITSTVRKIDLSAFPGGDNSAA